MPRPENPIPGDGPLADLARALRQLRERAGRPGYRQLAAKTHYSPSVLADAASGKNCPTWDAVSMFAQACGKGPDDELRGLWVRAHAAHSQQKAQRQSIRSAGETAQVLVERSASFAYEQDYLAFAEAREPDPTRAYTAAQYVRQLRALRAWAGQPSHKQISHASGTPMLASSTMYDALNSARTTLPRLEVVRAIVTACAPAAVDTWITTWQAIKLREFERANPMPPDETTADSKSSRKQHYLRSSPGTLEPQPCVMHSHGREIPGALFGGLRFPGMHLLNP